MRRLETFDWKWPSESSSSCGVGSREAIWFRRKLRSPRKPVEVDGGSPAIAMDREKLIRNRRERERDEGFGCIWGFIRGKSLAGEAGNVGKFNNLFIILTLIFTVILLTNREFSSIGWVRKKVISVDSCRNIL